MTANASDYNGLSCRWLGNARVRLGVTTGRGPRVVWWGWRDGGNLFAELPDMTRETPEGPYHFLGGHRLWYAPEVLTRTFWPDDAPPAVADVPGGARFTAPPDGAGIVKELTITLDGDEPRALVRHTLRNAGRWPVELAPWALSMCRPGGVVLLPQPREVADPDGLLPNRRFVFWPYSDPADRRFHLGSQVALVRGESGPINKLGYLNHDGWVAYWLDGTLFSRRYDPRPDAAHPDIGCNAECYLHDRFVEVEALSPLVRLEPGATVHHDETWRLHANVPPVSDEAAAAALAARLGL